jgi:ATPase subunit of ABC transporter with duplicated ATPase domains
MSVVLSDVSFAFPDGRVLFDKLSASFNPGRTGLIGVNGSGKSTLLRALAGLDASRCGATRPSATCRNAWISWTTR